MRRIAAITEDGSPLVRTTNGSGQRVRVYTLTSSGRKQLAAESSKWERISQAIAGLMEPPAQEGEA